MNRTSASAETTVTLRDRMEPRPRPRRPESRSSPRRSSARSSRELPGPNLPEVLGLTRFHGEEALARVVAEPAVEAVAHNDLVGLRDAAETGGQVDRVADDADVRATERPKLDHLQIAGGHRNMHAGRG